ncbi:hypothetical protein QYF61_002019, partial [Mycteria americana]
MSLSTTSTHLLNTSRDGDSTTSLGSLLQCLTTLSVKTFFLISNLNLPWHNLRPFPLVLWLVTWEKRPTLTSLQSSFRYEGPKTEHRIRGAASAVPSTGDNYLPSPAGHTIFDTSQYTVGLLGHLGTLPAHIQSAIDQHPQHLQPSIAELQLCKSSHHVSVMILSPIPLGGRVCERWASTTVDSSSS